MNKAILAVGIIFIALVTFAMINIVQDFSTGQELDYYLLKETTDAAMIDAIDYSFYNKSGSIRMDREKFVESFVRRFANNVTSSKDYELSFYDINETPPKASVVVETKTIASSGTTQGKIRTEYDAIIENLNKRNNLVEKLILTKDKKRQLDAESD